MRGILEQYLKHADEAAAALQAEDSHQHLARQVSALYAILSDIFGTDRLVLKASKLEAMKLLKSDVLAERVLALEKLVYEDPTLDQVPEEEEIPRILEGIQEEIADYIARRSVEDRLERKIAEKMQERHEEYVQEIKMQILKEKSGPENAQTLKRLAILEKLNQTSLARSAMEVLRPKRLEEIVGQERAVKALVSKIASPFPQHIILYGPPGVGKTTAARLALEAAKEMRFSPFGAEAPFIEVNGATLRWDPREVTNPLLGSVHDPIYQGARRDLADTGIPEPKLGLVTDAHGGVLFIDEIGEMDPLLLNKLLKVLEDKRVEFDSAYYDPHDDNVPQYIKKIFEEGAPADFLLIGATTRDPGELNPALRSRCAEVYFEPLTPVEIQEIITRAADKLGVELEPEIPEIISEYTIEGRKANNILADAYGLALYRRENARGRKPKKVRVTASDVYEVVQSARLSPYVTLKASEQAEVGRVLGLAVAGFVGSVLEIEAVAFPAREPGKGSLRFNDTAGSMARDSVFNAASVFRKVTGQEMDNYDVHINVVGGGNIDGPSAGAAVLLAIISAVQSRPLRQDTAITGELSIQGKVKPVGGVCEKIYGAKQAGVRAVLVPRDNAADIPVGLKGIEAIPVSTIEEVIPHVFIDHEALTPAAGQ
ncbi:anti-sigma H factor [Clostridiales bacterium PH28_bin88]|nr:anti-sigma H factor [Clostridiales bacterium PH28_bin88]